ncbi:MAG: DNA polymerase III subunit alpha, partial [Oscillospiraceae bacterium]|nr:DNA polymerase III subunit alpha [Oscillospiraceae bacterium]
EAGGKFTSFENFCRRMAETDLNRRAAESLIKCGAFDSLGANRRQLMQVCPLVIDTIADEARRHVEGQMDLFGSSGDESGTKKDSITLPKIEEFSVQDKMIMEREVTGLYLSGHPMDGYRSKIKRINAVPIGRIIEDCAENGGEGAFADNDEVTVAGVVSASKTRPTKNGALMAYVTLDDGTGSIETLCFRQVLERSGAYLNADSLISIKGRLSIRDEKPPQIMANEIRPLSDLDAQPEKGEELREKPLASKEKKLYLRLPSVSDARMEKLKLILNMFPGEEKLVIYFVDTGKRAGTSCIIHRALVNELCEMFGEENVVVK